VLTILSPQITYPIAIKNGNAAEYKVILIILSCNEVPRLCSAAKGIVKPPAPHTAVITYGINVARLE